MSQELAELLRDRIRRRGPIPFAEFMEAALYEPGLGYYRTLRVSATPLDYQTSPQVHPAFGRLLARELARVWRALDRPDPFVLVEPGAGDGLLATQIIDALRDVFAGVVIAYHPVELRDGLHPLPPPRHGEGTMSESGAQSPSPSGLDVSPQARSISQDPSPCRGGGKGWGPSSSVGGEGAVHCIVSNEFFDALPVHRLVWSGGRLREIYVDWGGDGFVERLGDPSDLALTAWIDESGAEPEEGWRGEVCLRLEAVFAAFAQLISRGVVLSVDYGYERADPRRGVDTLVAYHRHHWSDDVYRRVGEQDLTCHVDLAALARVGQRHGFEPAGCTTQRQFLLGHGLAEEAKRWIGEAGLPAREWQARFALAELVRPDGLGRLKVFAEQKGVSDYWMETAEYRTIQIPHNTIEMNREMNSKR